MVCIAEEPESDPTKRLNLDNYNSNDFNEYLSDNMETTPPTTQKPKLSLMRIYLLLLLLQQ